MDPKPNCGISAYERRLANTLYAIEPYEEGSAVVLAMVGEALEDEGDAEGRLVLDHSRHIARIRHDTKRNLDAQLRVSSDAVSPPYSMKSGRDDCHKQLHVQGRSTLCAPLTRHRSTLAEVR